MADSALYAAISRIEGADSPLLESIGDNIDRIRISWFNTPESIGLLGEATSGISNSILCNIQDILRRQQREIIAERGAENDGRQERRRQIQMFELTLDMDYETARDLNQMSLLDTSWMEGWELTREKMTIG